jgi:hypothetical protein
VTHPHAPTPALTALVERVVDFAGLFPPARLSMEEAVRAYADYRRGPQAWMLGRFVVPAARLEEFDEAGRDLLPDAAAASWALSAVVGADVELDTRSVHRFNDYHRDVRHGAVHVDTVELKVATPAAIAAADEFVDAFDAFLEVPIADDPDPLIAAIADVGAKAKVRTGGLTPDAIPGERHLLRFIRRCLDRGVAFKATAGLHHPLRGEYALTYESDAPRGVMYGFLNVFLTVAFVRQGADDGVAVALLDERDPASFEIGHRVVRWRGHEIGTDELRAARHEAVAFGSCSFREPVDDLRRLGLL